MIDLTTTIDPKTDPQKAAIASYLKEAVLTSKELEDACKKEKKTLDGVMSYIEKEARKAAVNGKAMIPDAEVYGWAVTYIEDDSLDCEKKDPKPVEKKEPAKPAKPDLKLVEPQLSLFGDET